MISKRATIIIILALFTITYILFDPLTTPPPPTEPAWESRSRLNIPNPPPLEVSRGGIGRNNKLASPQPQPIEMVVESTAYSHTGSQTYTGTWPIEGRTIAVDPETIPIGSRVFIEELGGWYIAEDKIPPESVEKGAIVDVFMDDEDRCWQWGRRDITMLVVPPGKPPQK